MDAYRDFDAVIREREREQDRRPIRFKLGGEELETLAVVPGGFAIDLVASGQDAVAYRRFLRGVLRDDDGHETDDGFVPSSLERFDMLMYGRENPIDGGIVRDIVEWLAGEYAGRPTERSSASADGPHTDGQPSSNGAGSPAATRESSTT